MPENLQGFFAEAKKGRFSTVANLSEEDIGSVWENVCNYIEKQMLQQKGVQIPNFGTFSFSQRRLDIGNNKFLQSQRPVFNISEKFAQTLGLQFNKYNVPGHIPSPPLNFAALSFETPFDRDTVDNCVKEIVNSISRAVAARRNVELVFQGIGRLIIRDLRVKMRFYKEFINQMDGSGNMISSMQNRPGTVDSVMSNHSLSRPATSNTLILPRIQRNNVRSCSNLLEPLAEQEETLPPNLSETEPLINTTSEDAVFHDASVHFSIPKALELQNELEGQTRTDALHEDVFEDFYVGDSLTQTGMENVLNEGVINVQPIEFSPQGVTDSVRDDHKMTSAPGRSSSRMAMPLAKATGVSLLDDLVPSGATPIISPATQGEAQIIPPEMSMSKGDSRFLKPPTAPRLEPFHRSHSLQDLTSDHLPQKPLTPPGSSCGHPNAGQELCYLCHQRARRNIPVYFKEERQRRDEEEERLLHQYQAMRDAEDLLKEQERQISRRHDLQKISAFNMGVAESVNAKKRAKDYNLQRSYIFQRRPLTPPRFPKQEEYLKELTKQVETKESAVARKKADDDFLERLEQVQLAEDLAAQREQYIKDKEEQKDIYKRALSAQLRYKPVPLPPREPDIEIFGKNDMNNEKMAERRRRACQLSQEQQNLISQRKRDALLRQLADQEHDQMVLERLKKELLDDRAYNHKVRFDSRRRLEDDWMKATEIKRARDLEDRLIGLESGMLLHEQCDQYNHCKQCKRRLNNCGESNIWSESRYVPGSRIMV